MRRMKIFSVIILLACFAGASNLSAQRGMRGFMRDSLRMNRPDTAFMNRMHMNRAPMQGRSGMYGMRNFRDFNGRMEPSFRGPMGRRFDFNMPGPGGRNMFPMPPARFRQVPDSAFMFHRGRLPMERGEFLMENIPNLSDSQKAKIKELATKNQAEMKKLMESNAAAIKKMRDQHRTRILDILNPEQKKWFESKTPAPGAK